MPTKPFLFLSSFFNHPFKLDLSSSLLSERRRHYARCRCHLHPCAVQNRFIHSATETKRGDETPRGAVGWGCLWKTSHRCDVPRTGRHPFRDTNSLVLTEGQSASYTMHLRSSPTTWHLISEKPPNCSPPCVRENIILGVWGISWR